MFDVNEIEGMVKLAMLENGTRRVDNLESGKSVLIRGNEEEHYKATFTKQNGSSFKVSFGDADGSNTVDRTLLTNGALLVFVKDCGVITMIYKDGGLDIIASSMVDIFVAA